MVIALQEEQLAEHGGQPGLRDAVLLAATLDRPRNLFSYSQSDLSDLAASCAYGIVKNHPFLDGNKRASLVASETFLSINGREVMAEEAAKVEAWISIADGSMSETAIASWFRIHAVDIS